MIFSSSFVSPFLIEDIYFTLLTTCPKKPYHYKYQSKINITNFIRRGDPVANFATSVGTPQYIETDSYIASTSNLAFEFHSITNFRYQGYSGGDIILTGCNKDNVNILKTHKGVYTEEKFNAVFTEKLHEKI